jgi:RNA 2',3'-cyclic 3'-phosphodiesterase
MTRPATVEGGERLRLFAALRLSENALERIVEWQARELRDERRVPRENLHVTLAFLGSTPRERLEAVAEAVRAAAARAPRPSLTVAGYRETRSAGMVTLADEDGRATALADDVQGRLEELGVYRREARPWLPHLTVLRFRDRPRLRPPLPDLGEVVPSEAAVYLSVLRPSGAQYRLLHSAPLGG